jgi:hypothetical protein
LTRLKRSAVHLLLAVFAAWPLVQIGMTRLYRVNPWKLAGWGMYAAPQIPPDLRVFCLTPDAVGVYELRTLTPGLQASSRRFLRRRLGLGTLAEPDAFAADVLAAYPVLDGVRLVVGEPYLDRDSGMVETRTSTYEYARPTRPSLVVDRLSPRAARRRPG